MEEKLAKYRAAKTGEDPKSTAGSYLKSVFKLSAPSPTRNEICRQPEPQISHNENEKLAPTTTEAAKPIHRPDQEHRHLKLLTVFNYLLKVILWVLLMWLFIKIEFGAVYFATSLLYLLYRNTRTRPKMEGEISAYSVFNENCESIAGTFDAEQFERQTLFRPKPN